LQRLQHAAASELSPELRNQLLEMAREWMHAIIAEEDGSETPAPKVTHEREQQHLKSEQMRSSSRELGD
jgi:hypothetical protein